MPREMFYPIWLLLPRPRFFPDDPDLHRLIDTNFDPGLRGFSFRMKRRNARDLRKGILGSKGLLKVPGKGGELPNGWILRLRYYATGEYDAERGRMKAGDVDAEFLPPTMREWPGARPNRGAGPPGLTAGQYLVGHPAENLT